MSEVFNSSDIDLPVPLNSAPEGERNFETPFYQGDDSTIITTTDDPPDYKPYPFALRPVDVTGGDNPEEGIQIYFGVLVHQVNRMIFNTDGLVSQTGLSNPQVIVPTQMEGLSGNRYRYYDLNWRGDVFLYWETDSAGVVNFCEFRGKDGVPATQDLPNDDGGKFYVKIGNVAAGNAGYDIPSLDQNISTDVYWLTAFAVQEDSSSNSSSSDSGSTSVSDSGSDKSTAIIPMDWYDKGYGAMFTMESNEVLFEFVMRDIPVNGTTTKARIDDRFLAVCEPDSLVVTGVTGDKLGPVGAVVNGNEAILDALPISFLRPNKVTLKLTGTRKGFKGFDMPERSERQFLANEKFINSAYPRE